MLWDRCNVVELKVRTVNSVHLFLTKLFWLYTVIPLILPFLETLLVFGVAQRLGYGLDDQDLIPGRGYDGIFSLHHRVQTSSGAQLALYPIVTGALTLRVKWPRCEADHSPPSNVKVKNVCGAIPPFLHYVFMAWCLIKQRICAPDMMLN
jgi:hypothetical protein